MYLGFVRLIFLNLRDLELDQLVAYPVFDIRVSVF